MPSPARRAAQPAALLALLAFLLVLVAMPSAAAARKQKARSSCRTATSHHHKAKKHRAHSSCRKRAHKRARVSARKRDTVAPTAPGTPSATPGDARVSLSWAPASDNRAVAGYRVYRDGAQVGQTNSASYTNAGLENGRSYSFYVVAYDVAGNVSAASATVSATPVTAPPPPPAPVPEPSNRIYWGSYIEGKQTYSYYYGGTWTNAPWSSQTWNTFESNAAKKVSIVHWGLTAPWTNEFNYWATAGGPLNLVHNSGAINAVDFSTGTTPLRDIANGVYDAAITKWMQQAAAWGVPFFLLPDVEMNGPWTPYAPGNNGNTAADFVNAWRRMHDIAVAAGAGNITWVWCPNVDVQNRYTPFEDMYPGDGYVDWTGLDGFNKGATTWSYIFRSSYDRLVQLAPAKPIMISQTGSVDPVSTSEKTTWINDALTTQIPGYYNQIKALVWFNWRIYENNSWWDWPIESSASALNAFRQAIGSPYYAPRGSFTLPPRGTKVNPL